MAISYKNGKISETILKFDLVKGTDRYNINGVDLSKAVFYYREPQREFVKMDPSQYKILQSNANVEIQILDQHILDNALDIQVGLIHQKKSTWYVPNGKPDIDILTDRYNQLEEDMLNLYHYVSKVMMIADTTDFSHVLPQLEKDEVWVKTLEGFKGVSIADVQTAIQNTILKFSHDIVGTNPDGSIIKPETGMVKTVTDYVTNRAFPQAMQGAKTEVDKYVDTHTKPDLDNKLTDLKGEMAKEFQRLYHEHTITVADASVYNTPTMITITGENPLVFHPTKVDEASDGILIPNYATNEITIYTRPTVIDLPQAGTDSNDQPLVADEYYFHDNNVEGRPSRDKPTGLGVFQVLFKYLGNNSILLDIEVPFQNQLHSINDQLATKKELNTLEGKVTTNKAKLDQTAVGVGNNATKIGDLSTLKTIKKSNLVEAVNEVRMMIKNVYSLGNIITVETFEIASDVTDVAIDYLTAEHTGLCEIGYMFEGSPDTGDDRIKFLLYGNTIAISNAKNIGLANETHDISGSFTMYLEKGDVVQVKGANKNPKKFIGYTQSIRYLQI